MGGTALAAALRVAVSREAALSAKLKDPVPGAGQLETARLARSQHLRRHLRPRPPKPAPEGSHLFNLGWRTLQPARRGHAAAGAAREIGMGASEREAGLLWSPRTLLSLRGQVSAPPPVGWLSFS